MSERFFDSVLKFLADASIDLVGSELQLLKHPLLAVTFGVTGLLTGALMLYRRRLSRPPGWGIRRFAEFCFSKRTFTQVLEPPLSDMEKEHFDALAVGCVWKARMALLRGHWSFWSAVAAQLPISFARRVYEVWKATKAGS